MQNVGLFIAIAVSTPVSDIPSKPSETNPIPVNGKLILFSEKISINDLGYLGNETKNSISRSIIPTSTNTDSTQVYVINMFFLQGSLSRLLEKKFLSSQ